MSESEADYLLLAQPLLQAGNVEGAMEMIDRAISADERDHQAWRMKSLLLESVGRSAEAGAAKAKADKYDVDGIDSELALGAEKAMQGDHSGAIAIFEKLLESDETLYEAWSALALSRLEDGQKQAALEAARRAAALEPNEPHLHYTVGRCLRLCGHEEEAIAAFDQALAISPGHALCQYEKGMALEQAERLDEALACFQQVHQQMPQDPNAEQAISAIEALIKKRDSQ